MTLTIASNFETITIGSSIILDDLAANPNDYSEVNIYVYINCCSGGYSLTITDSDLTGPNEYVIDKDFFEFSDDELPDGVYQVSIEAIPVSGDNTQETQCTFLDQFFGCQVATKVANDCNTDAHILYDILMRADECNCYCSDMCLIYDRILQELDETASYSCSETTTSNCSSC